MQDRIFRLRLALAVCPLAVVLAWGTDLETRSLHAQPPALVEFSLSGRVHEGLRLIELADEVVVIGRDGWLHSLSPSESIRPVSGTYQPIPAVQMRNDLRAEYGRNFEVIATTHFLVVQPVGRGNMWPEMFERSHRAFFRFMQLRGVVVRQGSFPMVAVVMPDEAAMYAEMNRLGIDMTRVAGVYSNNSNRVITHDGGRRDLAATTVRHEAAHQSAFNSGVHSRVNDTPKWITEGLGQLFEPEAMSVSRQAASMRELINNESLRILTSEFDLRDPHAMAPWIERLIHSDDAFKSDKEVETAYAVSWAIMFYLAHRQTDAFAEILNHTSNRRPFVVYSRREKAKDFQRITGYDALEMSQRITRFLSSL